LVAAWQEYEDTDDAWVAVLTGQGGAFSVGHDVQELAHGEGEEASPEAERGLLPLELSKAVIAAIEGPCYGLGFELALACDLRIAGERAMFGFPDQNLYVGYKVATVLLPRMTNLGVSLDLLFTGKIMDARRAEQVRLVSELAPAGQALARAVEAAKGMAQRFGSAEAFQKRRLWGLSGVPLPTAQGLVRTS
jgi:enoyl-CoA hydratase